MLHWIAGDLRDLIVGREGHRLLNVARRPAQIGDAIGGFANADAFLRSNFVERQTCSHGFLLRVNSLGRGAKSRASIASSHSPTPPSSSKRNPPVAADRPSIRLGRGIHSVAHRTSGLMSGFPSAMKRAVRTSAPIAKSLPCAAIMASATCASFTKNSSFDRSSSLDKLASFRERLFPRGVHMRNLRVCRRLIIKFQQGLVEPFALSDEPSVLLLEALDP